MVLSLSVSRAADGFIQIATNGFCPCLPNAKRKEQYSDGIIQSGS